MPKKDPAARPFVKCAGGKGRMLRPVTGALPGPYRTYFEPFVGGGAVFFEMLRLGRFRRAVLGDSNPDLMALYEVVQSRVDNLVKELSSSKYRYRKDLFLKMRERDPSRMDPVHRAARVLYLVKTAFNGLYRVNRKGQFNTPFGKYDDPRVCDEAGLRLAAAALRGVKLVCGDFEAVLAGARKGDAAYLDPPYIPLSGTSKFTQYSKDGFTAGDHWRLRGCFGALVDAGVRTVLSNSTAPLSYTLYGSFQFVELDGARVIGGPAEYRNPVKELMVVGGPL